MRSGGALGRIHRPGLFVAPLFPCPAPCPSHALGGWAACPAPPVEQGCSPSRAIFPNAIRNSRILGPQPVHLVLFASLPSHAARICSARRRSPLRWAVCSSSSALPACSTVSPLPGRPSGSSAEDVMTWRRSLVLGLVLTGTGAGLCRAVLAKGVPGASQTCELHLPIPSVSRGGCSPAPDHPPALLPQPCPYPRLQLASASLLLAEVELPPASAVIPGAGSALPAPPARGPGKAPFSAGTRGTVERRPPSRVAEDGVCPPSAGHGGGSSG